MAHGKNTSVLFNAFDLSSYFNQADTNIDQSTGENTGFQPAGGARTYEVGLNGGTVSLSGFFNGAATGVDAKLSASINQSADDVVSIAPEGVLTLGKIVKLLASQLTQYQVSSPLDGIVTVSGSFQANGGIQSGVVLHPLGAETATGNDTSLDQTAATSNGGVAHLHVPTVSGTTPSNTVVVQHSTDNSVFTDLITFTAATAATQQRSTVTGTVNRYVRTKRTISGTTPSFTYMCAFARRP